MEVAWEDSQRITVSPDCYQEIVTVPRCGKYSYNYFVKLELHDKYGKLLSENLILVLFPAYGFLLVHFYEETGIEGGG